MRFGDALMPSGSYWTWQDYQVHLDRLAQPDSPILVSCSLKEPELTQLAEAIIAFIAGLPGCADH